MFVDVRETYYNVLCDDSGLSENKGGYIFIAFVARHAFYYDIHVHICDQRGVTDIFLWPTRGRMIRLANGRAKI